MRALATIAAPVWAAVGLALAAGAVAVLAAWRLLRMVGTLKRSIAEANEGMQGALTEVREEVRKATEALEDIQARERRSPSSGGGIRPGV